MRAQLIGESSAGMTAVEIYNDNEDLVWSNNWFANGATGSYYNYGLCEAWDCMRDCADVADYDGGEFGDDGEPVPMDVAATTGIILEYDSNTNTWAMGADARNMGQSEEILDACMSAGLLPADDIHDDRADDKTVNAIVDHIRERMAN